MSEEDSTKIKLSPEERYILSSCARHADILGLTLSIPLGLLVTSVLRKGRLRNKSPLTYIKYQVGTAIATYCAFAPVYMGTACWGYLDILPDESQLKRSMLHSYEESSSRGIYTKMLVIVKTFRNKVSDDDAWYADDITAEQKHEIQKKLRWVSEVEARPQTKVSDAVSLFVNTERMRATLDDMKRATLKDVAHGKRKKDDEDLRNLR